VQQRGHLLQRYTVVSARCIQGVLRHCGELGVAWVLDDCHAAPAVHRDEVHTAVVEQARQNDCENPGPYRLDTPCRRADGAEVLCRAFPLFAGHVSFGCYPTPLKGKSIQAAVEKSKSLSTRPCLEGAARAPRPVLAAKHLGPARAAP